MFTHEQRSQFFREHRTAASLLAAALLGAAALIGASVAVLVVPNIHTKKTFRHMYGDGVAALAILAFVFLGGGTGVVYVRNHAAIDACQQRLAIALGCGARRGAVIPAGAAAVPVAAAAVDAPLEGDMVVLGNPLNQGLQAQLSSTSTESSDPEPGR